MARQTIVDACAALVTERRHLDFSIKEVAERARVSLRTVYNHFATREELLDALATVRDELADALGSPSARDVRTREDLLYAVRRNLEIFSELGGIGEAMAQLPLADVGRDVEREQRTRLIVDAIAREMPSVPDDDARAIGIVLRHLVSHRSWFWLTQEYGLDTAQVVRIVSWAIETLLDAAESTGGLPDGDG